MVSTAALQSLVLKHLKAICHGVCRKLWHREPKLSACWLYLMSQCKKVRCYRIRIHNRIKSVLSDNDHSQLFVRVNWPPFLSFAPSAAHINPFSRRRPGFLLLHQDSILLSTEKNPFNYLYTWKSLHREMAMWTLNFNILMGILPLKKEAALLSFTDPTNQGPKLSSVNIQVKSRKAPHEKTYRTLFLQNHPSCKVE